MKKPAIILQKGFTLIELIVVVGILGFLIYIAVLTLNPLEQLNKSSDAQRRSDLHQVRQALDTYYNDHNCYPEYVPFGIEWAENDVVYMKKVPQDSNCYGLSPHCYLYQTDANSSCPQWNVLYGYMLEVKASQVLDSCPIRTICGSMSLKYNYCLTSGNIDCDYINSTPLPTPSIYPQPTPRPTNTPTPTPDPTRAPGQCLCTDPEAKYDIRAGVCNEVAEGPKYCNDTCTLQCF